MLNFLVKHEFGKWKLQGISKLVRRCNVQILCFQKQTNISQSYHREYVRIGAIVLMESNFMKWGLKAKNKNIMFLDVL